MILNCTLSCRELQTYLMLSCLFSDYQICWKERTGTCCRFPYRRFWRLQSWPEWMLFPHHCQPCWTPPKTCVLACLPWCLMDSICLPHLFIALSLPPTHRYGHNLEDQLLQTICLDKLYVLSWNVVSVSCQGPSRDSRAVCRSCITSQSVWGSSKIAVTSEICTLLQSCCPVVHQPSAPCTTPTTQGTFSWTEGC